MIFRNVWQCQQNIYLHSLTAPSFDIRFILKAKILLWDIGKALFIGKIPILVLPSSILSFTLKAKMSFQKSFWNAQRTFSKVLCCSRSCKCEWFRQRICCNGLWQGNREEWGLRRTRDNVSCQKRSAATRFQRFLFLDETSAWNGKILSLQRS